MATSMRGDTQQPGLTREPPGSRHPELRLGVWPLAMHFLCLETFSTAGLETVLHPVRAPQLHAKGPEDTPTLSLSSLLLPLPLLLPFPLPLPLFMPQMAILLTASKKVLH